MSRAERAKPLQDDLTTTRNHTPKPTLGISMPARAAPFARTGAEALDVSAGSAANETKVHYGYGYLTCTLQLRGKDLPAKAALGSDSRARTRAAGRALVARGRDRARSASQLTKGAARRCCTRCQLAHSRCYDAARPAFGADRRAENCRRLSRNGLRKTAEHCLQI